MSEYVCREVSTNGSSAAIPPSSHIWLPKTPLPWHKNSLNTIRYIMTGMYISQISIHLELPLLINAAFKSHVKRSSVHTRMQVSPPAPLQSATSALSFITPWDRLKNLAYVLNLCLTPQISSSDFRTKDCFRPLANRSFASLITGWDRGIWLHSHQWAIPCGRSFPFRQASRISRVGALSSDCRQHLC